MVALVTEDAHGHLFALVVVTRPTFQFLPRAGFHAFAQRLGVRVESGRCWKTQGRFPRSCHEVRQPHPVFVIIADSYIPADLCSFVASDLYQDSHHLHFRAMQSSPRGFRLGQLLRHGNAWQSPFHFNRPLLHRRSCSSATYPQRTTPRPQVTGLRDGSPKAQMNNTIPRPTSTRRRKKMIRAIHRPCARYTHASARQSARDSPRSFRARKSAVSRSARKRKDTRLYWIISQETFWIPQTPCEPSLRQPCSPSRVCA